MARERSKPGPPAATWTIARAAARARLTEFLNRRGPLEMVEAALFVAAEEYPELDVDLELERVRQIALEGARRVGGLSNPFARLDGLSVWLFEELGFRGDRDDYDDPRNSFLNQVLARRVGIPLTLSILFIEVARAAGFAARGVALPGHFVARVERDGRSILVDPFHRGQVITVEDCRSLVSRSTGRPWLFQPALLAGTTERAMLARLLLNLKHVYLTAGDYTRALWTVERLLLLAPDDSGEIRDRGLLRAHLGRPVAAIADLERYLALAPGAPDLRSVEDRLVRLRRRLAADAN
jgi:regulator of sirC expression with transglutaminase-like and TPR domain